MYYNTPSLLVRNPTAPTERLPLVVEVGANFWGVEGVAWSAQHIPTVLYLGFVDWNPIFFIQVAPRLT
jgi:hypothetical protein